MANSPKPAARRGTSEASTGASAATPGESRPWYRRKVALLLVFPGLFAALLGLLLFFFLFAAVPLPEDVGAASTMVFDRNGAEVGTLNPQAARQDIAIASLPPYVPLAVMSAEDRGFREHHGISVTGVVRALFANARAGEVTQGGSTITQQYVKNALLTSERSFVRKAKEAALAVKVERRFDKDKILEMYLNTIYWGRGAYGIEAAANTYFAKSATELTLNEAVTLAGMIQSPERLDPLENPERADGRRTYVIGGMPEVGFDDQAALDQAAAEGLPTVSERANVEYGTGAYYIDAVRRVLADEIGEAAVYQGLRIHTEMDLRVQGAAEQVMRDALAGQTYSGALVSIDPGNGGVRALVGGRDFATEQFNSAVRAIRQPGSTFKAVALAKFIADGFSPESRFSAPAQIEVPDGNGGTTTVTNYDQKDHGTQTVYEATRSSTNTVFMQIADEVKYEGVAAMGHELGIPEERDLPPVASLTLGAAGVTPLELTSVYATLAAGGVYTTPTLIVRVEDREGKVIFEPERKQEPRMQANDAYIVTDALRGVINNGTGGRADLGRPAAGKTGTTSDYKDAWFAGYVPQLATAIWMGRLDNTAMEEKLTGGSAPAEAWGAYMRAALEGVDAVDFPRPDLSDKRIINAEPEPSPTPEDPCATGEPPEGGTTDGGQADGGTVAVPTLIPQDTDGDGKADTCVEVTPSPTDSPSPSESPSPAESPSPSPADSPKGKPTDPSPSPSPSPSPEPSPSPQTSPEPSPSPVTTVPG